MTLIEILQEYDVDFRQHGESQHVSEGWLGIVCPYCGIGTGNYGMGISIAHGSCSCWKCGVHRLWDVVRDVTGEEPRKIAELLKGMRWDRRAPTMRRRGKLVLPHGLGALLPIHKAYLRHRGFDPVEVERLWGLKGIGLSARLAWRVFIPITFRGETVSWTTRAVSDQAKLRYENAKPEEEVFPAKSLLFGHDMVRHAIIVTEGPMDAMRVGPGAVATLGVGVTRAQVLLISRHPIRIIIFDSEPAAQRRAKILCRELSAFAGKTIRVEIDAADPGSASPKEVRKLRREFLE